MHLNRRIIFLFVAIVALAVYTAGCGLDSSGQTEPVPMESTGIDTGQNDDDDSYFIPTDDDDDFTGCPGVVWTYERADSYAAPANPHSGLAAPDKYNRVGYFRFRPDSGDEDPTPVRMILLLLPGFTVGGGYLTYMAEEITAMGCGEIEVWVMDRRYHNLEDLTGMEMAEQEREPDIAYDYYFDGLEINNKTFAGFIDGYGAESDPMSEWGLDVLVQDIRTVIHQIPEENRQTNVFLGGHSRGAAHIKAFAAYEFDDGVMGCDEIAGLVMVDGESRYMPIFTEGLYTLSLMALRLGLLPRFITVPPLGPPIYTWLEIMAMAASEETADTDPDRFGPQGVFGRYGPVELVVPILFRFQNISLSNEALIGLFLDSESGPVSLLHGGLGKVDGPVKHDFLGDYPSDENHFYQWLHYDEVDPQEYCDVQDLVKSFYMGPSNVTDPYYCTRLDLDFWVANTMDNEDNWRGAYFPLFNSRMDAPVYFLGTALLSEKKRHLFYRSQLPPVRGQDLPREEYGFDILMIPEWQHLDSAFARTEINPFFPDLITWMNSFAEGEVQVP